MTTTARQVLRSVHALSPAERLQLAAVILDELTRAGAPPALVDGNDMWSEQDRSALTAFSLDYAASQYPEDEDLI
jgi:hypothetical protein